MSKESNIEELKLGRFRLTPKEKEEMRARGMTEEQIKEEEEKMKEATKRLEEKRAEELKEALEKGPEEKK